MWEFCVGVGGQRTVDAGLRAGPGADARARVMMCEVCVKIGGQQTVD